MVSRRTGGCRLFVCHQRLIPQSAFSGVSIYSCMFVPGGDRIGVRSRCDYPVRVQRTVFGLSGVSRVSGAGSLRRCTRRLPVAARQTPPSSARKNSLQQRCPFCFVGNHRHFVWSPAFRRSRPAKAGTPCNFPRRPCFVMESVRGLDVAKKPSHGVPPWATCQSQRDRHHPPPPPDPARLLSRGRGQAPGSLTGLMAPWCSFLASQPEVS